MSKTYTAQEITAFAAFYEEHGAVRLPGLIEPDWVTRISETVDAVAAQADSAVKPGSVLSFGKAEGRMTIRFMWREIDTVRDFLFRPEMSALLAKIVGSKSLRFWFDLTFIHSGVAEGGKGAGTGWHHDMAAFGFKGDKLPSLWMALTPATADRSRLMFIDGSHKTVRGLYRPPSGYDEPADGDDGFLDVPDFDAEVAAGREKILTWDCDPGDAIVIHPLTIHGAQGNSGDQNQGRRVAITTRWLGDDVRWYPLNKIGTRMPGIAESHIVNGSRPEGDWFPLVYDESSNG